ncbi:MAG TPA: translation initiation factor IF-2 [Nitrososphaerales archaeon]
MVEGIRQPVVVVLGHVDSGKTSLLDKIRGTAVQAREAGGITQHIGASFFPISTISEICGPLLKHLGILLQIPGILVIDTPGHEVFTNLRSRGGSAADISILVVDSSKGFEIQTLESVEILKRRKVPFVVALNKIDMIASWKRGQDMFMSNSIKGQNKYVQDELDNRIYSIVGSLSRIGFESESYNRVKDFTKEIAIVPVSAKTGEGIPELLTVLIGLTQQYLLKRLGVSKGKARGIVLEVKEEPSLGSTANVILLDGVLKIGDSVIMGKRDGAFVSRVKAIFMPKPLDEMRDPRDKFSSVESISAASGIKLVTPDLEGTLAGSPLVGLDLNDDVEEIKRTVFDEIKRAFIYTDGVGVVLKSDTLGSLEALVDMLKLRNIPIRVADIGPVTRRDVVEARTVADKDKYLGVVMDFGVRILPDAEKEIEDSNVKLFMNPVIYSLIEDYSSWVQSEKESYERDEFNTITPPSSFKFLKGYVFRRNDPAIFGVMVLVGRLKQKAQVMNSEGKIIGTIHQLQDKGKSVDEVEQGSEVAVSMNEPTIGRHIQEGETLYTVPKNNEIKTLTKKYLSRLSLEESGTLDKIIKMRRNTDPLYGL